MRDDLTAALFTGRDLRGSGPGAVVRDTHVDVVAGRRCELVHA